MKQVARPKGAQVGMVVHPDAAGIDVGAHEVYVAVPEDRDERAVRCFGKFTEDLYEVARWLKQCRVRTVAMESTGVYWIPLYQILESWGIAVCLVNAAHVRHVPGRKSDVQDCRWLQLLHQAGLLRASFRPPPAICTLRTLLRHREALTANASSHVLRMHKALELMNLQVQHVISDITGVSGLAILDAILAGERGPERLAELRDRRVRASADTMARSLVGDYRAEHLFTLRQSLEFFRFYQSQIAACDRQIEQHLLSLEERAAPGGGPEPPPARKPRPRQPDFDLHHHLHRALGVDLTEVPGINVIRSTSFYGLS
ncbi:MAG: IS110 family transposase, partial [Chloroflexota bacterium]